MIGRIYLIRNWVNGKGYVGKTVYSLAHRWSGHKASTKAGVDSLIYRAMRKYGIENFSIVEAIRCDESLLNDAEKHYIKFYGTHCNEGHGYNMTDGGEGALGYEHTSENLLKMSEIKLGKKRGPHSEEHKMKMSEAMKGNKNGTGNKG